MLVTVVLTVILLMVHGASMQAQHDVDVNAGAGISLSSLLGTMSPIPGIPSPGPLTFTPQGSSTRPLLQLGVDIPLTPLFRIGGRLGYTSYQFDLTADERLPIATEAGEIYQATIRHDLSMEYSAVLLEPYVRVEPLPWLGAQVGIPLYIPASTDYVQTQQFTDPPGLPFADGSTSQVTGSGQIPGMAAIVPGISIQADGLLPMLPDGSLMLNPFAGISTQITSWNTGTTMRTLSFNIGVGVRYRYTAPPPPPEPIRDTTVYRDTIVILSQKISNEVVELMTTTSDESRVGDTISITVRQRYQRLIPKPPAVLQASLRLSFESEVGGITKEARLIVSKVQRTRVVPLLPVVVFDEQETRVPDRYRRITTAQARTWSERDALTSSDIHWQYHVLNVIGDRLRRTPSTRVELIAYDDGTDEGRRVASERLLSVQRYLMAAFGIAERRLVIDLRHGQASQQPWVFLGDETRTLLKPLVVTDTIIESRLPRVRLSPDVVSEAGLRSWTVQTYNHGTLVKTFEGRGAAPATLIWDMGEDVSPDEAFNAAISTKLTVTDNEGATSQSEIARIAPKGPSAAEAGNVTKKRLRVLRWIGADYLHTPDLELFGVSPTFDRVDVYPSASRREDFFVVNVPAIVHPVNADAWFRRGLVEPERTLFDHAESYVREERLP